MKYYFYKYKFRKFEIVVCFASLLYGVKRNELLIFDSITDSVKSKTWNSRKRKHCSEEARRIMGNRTSRSRMRERQGRRKGNVPRLAPYSLHTDRKAESLKHCVGFRSVITACTIACTRNHTYALLAKVA